MILEGKAVLQLNIDCEGPITQNDNAFELCGHFIPDGEKFFAIISKYDDFLADVEKRPGYKAGDTLKLVLPFLKAFGVTDSIMEEFSRRTLLLLPGTELMLPAVNRMLPGFIISTSYRPYLDALCHATGFPSENVFCTEVSLDSYEIEDNEARFLRETSAEIAEMEMIHWPGDATGINDISPRHRKVIERLDEIFWKEIPGMKIGKIFDDVNPIGGIEKANAVRESLKRTGLSVREVIYVGDSITDVQALELVDSNSGVAVSFNGNRYAIRAARWAILSTSTVVVAGLCRLLLEKGGYFLEGLKLSGEGEVDTEGLVSHMKDAGLSEDIAKAIDGLVDAKQFQLLKVVAADQESLIESSERIRKSVRGHGIGNLG